MANDRIRIGILGAGGILAAHAAGFQANAAECEVVAVAKADPTRAEAVRGLFGPEVTITGDYQEVLTRADVDAVDILLPHDLHLPATVAAAEAGKPVLVEKVMARNIYECDRMIAACEAAGVSLSVCHDRRYQPDWMALKRVVDRGLLGEIYSWRLEHNQNVDLPPGHWIRSRDALGGGAVMSCLTHQIDGLRWYAGEVERVTCLTKTIASRMEGETIGVIAAQMQSGALAQLSINWATRSGGDLRDGSLWAEFNHVTGSRGEAYYLCGQGSFLMLYDEAERAADLVEEPPVAGRFLKLRAGDGSGHVRCITEWLKLLRGEPADFSTTGRDSRATVEVAEAAYRSAASGCAVALPIEPEPWPTS